MRTLEMKNIVKRFPGVLANDHVNLTIQTGEIHALLGENGAGKSTLMQILYGFHAMDSGEILIDSVAVHLESPKDAIALGIGMVHQEFMLVRLRSRWWKTWCSAVREGRGQCSIWSRRRESSRVSATATGWPSIRVRRCNLCRSGCSSARRYSSCFIAMQNC